MQRRQFIGSIFAATVSRGLVRGDDPAPAAADFTLKIAPVSIELAPKKIVRTTGYDGSSPGPLLRMTEGKPVTIDVYNDTGEEEIVHWHGLQISSVVDGSMEEGTPMIPAHANRRYQFTPKPAGTRWYHTHTMAGRNLKRGTYNGQFGFLYITPKNDAGRYDQEVFLALKEWDPYMSTGGDDEGTLDASYRYFSINDRALGHGEPIRVRQGQRVMLRILNASATMHRRIGLAGHKFQVIAMDGNPLPAPKEVEALELGVAERIDAIVEMDRPGVWVLGTTDDHDREAGMGVVVEYAGQTGTARWLPPGNDRWDYTKFGIAAAVPQPEATMPLVFQKKFAGHRWVDLWTINGKSFPKTDPIRVKANGRYRLIFDNRSDEAHPLHLHRHSFQLTKVEGVATSGVWKDVVVVQPNSQIEVDLVADNPGPTLFHCHQQMHMDYGFMAMMEYV